MFCITHINLFMLRVENHQYATFFTDFACRLNCYAVHVIETTSEK